MENMIYGAIKNLRRAEHRNRMVVTVEVISHKKYKNSNHPMRGRKGTQDRIKMDKMMKRANGRPIKWVEVEMGIGEIPKEWIKKIKMPLNSLLVNWKENI